MPFVYPTYFESRTIEQDYVRDEKAGRKGFDILPEREINAPKVRWTQQDNYGGLQAMRGLDGAPTRVIRTGYKTYEYEPGYFGEFEQVTETELQLRAQNINLLTTPIPVGDLVLECKKQLIGREYDRKESSIWTLLTTGVLQIKLDGADGFQAKVYNDAYAIQVFTPGIGWSTAATSTPLLNFQAIQQFGVGHSVDFGGGGKIYMNQVTGNRLLNNTNASDFGGRRNQYGATLNNMAAFNSYFAGQNLPNIEIYDEGYYTQLGTFYDPVTLANNVQPPPLFQKFIPDGVGVIVGRRKSGAPIGEYLVTTNINNGGQPGSYEFIKDYANAINAEKRVPPTIEVHRGHNGGPTIMFPGSIIVANFG